MKFLIYLTSVLALSNIERRQARKKGKTAQSQQGAITGLRSPGQGVAQAQQRANANPPIQEKIIEPLARPSAARGDNTPIQFRVAVPQGNNVPANIGMNVL